MTDTSVVISMLTPSMVSKSRSITHINNNVSGDVLISFARKFVDLTDNTYISTSVVKRMKLD